MAQTAEPNIDALLLAEQERLNKRKEELEIELSQLNARLGKINRYFSDEALQPFKLAPPKPRGDRRERGAVQEQVKTVIYQHPEGISSGDPHERAQRHLCSVDPERPNRSPQKQPDR